MLDPVPNGRWSPLRKFDLCAAIRRGEVTRDAAIAAHGLSAEELDDWLERQARGGVAALRSTTRLKELSK